jgi:hypothetical protein
MSQVQKFDFSVNLLRSVLWQYEGAEKLIALIKKENEWMEENNNQFWLNWIRDVFDLDTANDFGLSVWGRILNINLGFTVAPDPTKIAFGFGPNNANFSRGNFGRIKQAELSLTTEQKRLVLKLRYRQLTTRPTVIYINRVLQDIFGDRGLVYVADSLDMNNLIYFFGFPIDEQLRIVLEKFDVLPRPSTVGVKIQLQIRPSFGFGTNHLNFNRGNFGD